MKDHSGDAAEMMCVLCDNLMRVEGRGVGWGGQSAPVQFIELLLPIKLSCTRGKIFPHPSHTQHDPENQMDVRD